MKDKTVTILLTFFLGGIGIHRFYLGQPFYGLVYLLFSWTIIPFFIAFIDFIVFLFYSEEKFNLKYNNIKNDRTAKSDQEEIESENFVSFSSKSTSKNKTEMTIGLNEENFEKLLEQKQKEREEEINSYNYVPDEVQRRGIQLLESLSILSTTKNIDTLKGRYRFIKEIYDEFVKASYHNRYISDVQVAIDEYKTMYYDRVLNDLEIKLLVEPDHSNLIEYYSECLFNCFNEFYSEQMKQIDALKKEDAKERRKKKIVEIGNQTLIEFDRNGSENEKFKSYINSVREKLDNLNTSQNSKTEIKVDNPLVINPKGLFELTLYNANQKTLKQVTSFIKDDSTWNKPKDFIHYFAQHDIKCKEVDEYILQYKPTYQEKLHAYLDNSKEYPNATEKNKEAIEDEFKEEVINQLPERANCDLQVLFDYSEIDLSIDNKLVEEYGFDVVSQYLGLKHYLEKDKVITHLERKEFEDLLKAGLVITADEISYEELLKTQKLKTLNAICEKEEDHFKRKNKAINYLKEHERLLNNIGKFVATRNIFKLKPLPSKFDDVNLHQIESHWIFLEEYIKLIINTYRESERYKEKTTGDPEVVKGFRIEKMEDLNPNFICQRAREESKKKYSKSNPPKVPFHIGCNCDIRAEV
ncbi:MAG: hypothetical protein BRD50_00290 [Bacteroidetes bacterium SW_11_45_7]|nr:MAG: hypothetical protein BRD50_00290 [Bacteroidetes bacterium SW_11_45_7]